MEIVRQPLLIDQLRLLISSARMRGGKPDMPSDRLMGLSKKGMTESAREFAMDNKDLVPNFKPVAQYPILVFAGPAFQKQHASTVSLKAYGMFTIQAFGNPTRFQKQHYLEKGLIDQDLDQRVRLHEDNYIHTNICSVPIEQIEQDNRDYLLDSNFIDHYVSQDVLGHDPYMEAPTLYTDTSITYIEVNQDLLIPEHRSTDLVRALIKYFQTQDGLDYLYQIDCKGFSTKADLTSQGTFIGFDFGTKGKVKVYPKTKHSLRVEAALYGNLNIRPQLKNKRYWNLDKVIEDLAKPLLQRIDIPLVLEKQPIAEDLTPWIFDLLTDDPVMLNIANKLHQRRYLKKPEIPAHLRRKGKDHKFKGVRLGKDWYYVPKHLREGRDK